MSTRGVARTPFIESWLGVEEVAVCPRFANRLSSLDATRAVVGWGEKRNTQRAQRLAAEHSLPFWRLEDGFISYAEHPSTDSKRLSLIIDKAGIYYNASAPSALENLLNSNEWMSEDLLSRAARCLEKITQLKLCKYNHHRDIVLPEALERSLNANSKRVLVIDQTMDDCSVLLGGGSQASFDNMVDAALSENPQAQVFIKVHPDVIKKTKSGYISQRAASRISIIHEDVNPLSLLERFDKVYVVTSQMGMEALMLGKEVHCFGMPFYAGWGLTHDRQHCARRTKVRTLLELFAASYLLYPHYLSPIDNTRCELEEILDYLQDLQLSKLRRETCDTLWCVGFSPWKRSFVARFASQYARQVKFVPSVDKVVLATADDAMLTWGRSTTTGDVSKRQQLRHWRMEDGFLRSVGLGLDFKRPHSLVIDQTGIYFDCHHPSDLENILNNVEFSALQIARAERLRSELCRLRVSKYNDGDNQELEWIRAAHGREVILIPGQVADDASIKFGSPEITCNYQLITATRANKPSAFIVYKPHPDVIKGKRAGQVDEAFLSQHVDATETKACILTCIDACHEVHTMTSLTGFEALLRDKRVRCYGLPFYAGWGLTSDHISHPRRHKKLNINQLVAGALILYPEYVDWTHRGASVPELTVQQLANIKLVDRSSGRKHLHWIDRRLRKARFLVEAMLG